MHGAVSTALDLHSTRKTWRKRPLAERQDSAITVEVAREIRPIPQADLASTISGVEDVFPRERSEALSRALNVTVALVALVCLAPVFMLIALAIRLTSRGPVCSTPRRGWGWTVDSGMHPRTTGGASTSVGSRT